MSQSWHPIIEAVLAIVRPHESRLDTLLEKLQRLTEPSEMPRAIAVCQEALALVDKEEQPNFWAALQVQLGNSLTQNPLGDQSQDLEAAIRHFEQALQVRTREAFPAEWALRR
jgi:hypothetical protein